MERNIKGNDETPQGAVSRADLHCHSTASTMSKLGIQRSLALPECATEPEEVYALAKRRGMDFVTITDHDTIAGAEKLAHLPDTFLSEELTVRFRGEPQAAHVLCLGINADDHEWLQAHRGDIETCAAYLQEHEITAALAHPFYAVSAPLTARHRRRLAELFPIWETRNGSRAKELNRPAFVYIETHGGTAVGGSDDHAGIDIGRTFTETPFARTPAEFLENVRAGRARALGDQGSAAKWTHAAIALAIRSLGSIPADRSPSPSALLKITERLMREGEVREGRNHGDVGADDARALLAAWLQGLEFGRGGTRADVRPESESAGGTPGQDLLALLQNDVYSHADMERRAMRIHERRLAAAVKQLLEVAAGGDLPRAAESALALFDACLPAIPYAAATTFLGREKGKLARADGDRPRVAIVVDGIGSMHGVTSTIRQIRARGVPGFEVDVIGTDAGVDRRLASVAELEMPFYEGMTIGVPSLASISCVLADGNYDLVQIASPGPAGLCAFAIARLMDLPALAVHHTELGAYAGLRTGRPEVETLADMALGRLYGACGGVLSPSPSMDLRLRALGIDDQRIMRWDRGVDLASFSPEKRQDGMLPEGFNVLYAGRLTREKGIELLAESFTRAHARDPRLHLVLAGGGPEEGWLRQRLGGTATFLGWLEPDALARAYASADAFLFASSTDTFGQVLLEAQASGLPVLAVDRGGPSSLVSDGISGLLREPDADQLAEGLLQLRASSALRARLTRGALQAAQGRSWEGALGRLSDAYLAVLSESVRRQMRAA